MKEERGKKLQSGVHWTWLGLMPPAMALLMPRPLLLSSICLMDRGGLDRADVMEDIELEVLVAEADRSMASAQRPSLAPPQGSVYRLWRRVQSPLHTLFTRCDHQGSRPAVLACRLAPRPSPLAPRPSPLAPRSPSQARSTRSLWQLQFIRETWIFLLDSILTGI
ncbi:hypothetical protein EYF80_053950 [Liparis tanakae]|uniref:Uncharacterized protein n=1 Tax=Liparis tanakae TaxID=230148 RepID=A0A4Z2F457_9TELE|nr:hypothetical protein EYF80_053950 [Liparis tanakae]